MTDILLNWLNNEVKLSKNIQNISEDFANGYFFGELLYKYKLLPQFNQFQNNNKKFSITKNYILLQYKFDELKINFNDKDKTELLSKKKYKAEMILFQIRERIFSKLLQIDQITERIKNQKILNKVYKHVLNNTNPRKRIKNSKPKQKTYSFEEQKIKEKEEEINKNIKKKRLASANLPRLSKNVLNIGKNKQFSSGIKSIVANNVLNKHENKEIKDALKEIEKIENIHMKTKKNIEILEKKKHQNEEKRDKENFDSWKKSYQKIKQFEEEKNKQKLQKINRLKLATQNSFIKANHDLLIHINEFDVNLDHLGLNAKNELGVDSKKKNEISTGQYMKSIMDAVKEKEKMRKQYEIRIKRISGQEKLDNIFEDQKDIGVNSELEKEIKKRPKSSATTFMFYSNKNKNIDKDKIPLFDSSKNRSYTAKNILKKQIEYKENMLNDINQKYIRPKSGLYFNKNIPLNNNNELSEEVGSHLELIDDENSKKLDKDDKEDNSSLDDDYTHIDVYDEKKFFERIFREGGNYFRNKAKERHKEVEYNRKIIKNVVYSLLDITDLCYDYKKKHNSKLVDVEEWNKFINNFLKGKPLINN